MYFNNLKDASKHFTDNQVPIKQGSCPAVTGTGTCAQQCTPSDDRTCSGTAKCCYNGCGYTCMEPGNLFSQDLNMTVLNDTMVHISCSSGNDVNVILHVAFGLIDLKNII